MSKKHICWLTFFLPVLFVVFISFSSAQNCSERGYLSYDTDIWNAAPQYITGRGWVSGNKIDKLPRGTQIFVCQKISVGFAFSTQKWFQVAYYKNKRWNYAWVYSEAVKLSSIPKIEHKWLENLLSPSEAFAQPESSEGVETTSGFRLEELTPPPEELPPMPPTPTPVQIDTLTSTTTLYLYLFLAMFIGMSAKVVVDIIDSWDKKRIKRHLQKGLIALLVSPVTFLAFIQSAEFGMHGQKGFIILLLFAFQNGFFWQTVFKRDKDAAQAIPAQA